MIHLPTAAGGRVEHLVHLGQAVRRGDALARVHPVEGPYEEICAAVDGVVARQRLQGQEAPRYARVVGLTRVVLAITPGRVRWIATLGPVDVTTMVALVELEGCVRPHRAGGSGFVGQRYCRPGERVIAGQPLLEIRGEELV